MLKILQISFRDEGGGAEIVAQNLHREYRRRGHDARLAVGYRTARDEGTFEIDAFAGQGPWSSALGAFDRALENWPAYRRSLVARKIPRLLARPRRIAHYLAGREDFAYPGIGDAAGTAWRPDVVHLHNLHKDYVDLASLARAALPVVWTLHDAWAFTGHCGHPIDCERWRTGCGECPDLRRYPPIRRDATRANLARKEAIYAAANFRWAAPSAWLYGLARTSALGVRPGEVIPNGVDTAVFHSGDRAGARARLGFPGDRLVCLFVSQAGSKPNPYKDYATVRAAVARAPGAAFVCLGDVGRREPGVQYPGPIRDPAALADYYRAADVLLHAAHAENYPNVILEAMACGTPVVATAVGGIPEQVREGQNGFLVPRGDAVAMAARIDRLRADPALRARLSDAAAAFTRGRTVAMQAGAYEAAFSAAMRGSSARSG